MDHTTGITPTYAPTQEHQEASPPAQPADAAPAPTDAAPAPAPAPAPAGTDPAPADGSQPEPAGFQSRGRARRRARFLRKARELAYRDLGGLVFNLHRFGQRNDALVLAKLSTLGHIDDELRGIEATLGERRSITVLREAGITACPRCAAIHSSEDNFCPNCGLSMARHADLPAGFQSAAGAAAPPPQAPASTAAPPAAPSPPATPAPYPAPQSPAPQAVSSPPAQGPPAQAAPGEEDGPTEILRGPASGS